MSEDRDNPPDKDSARTGGGVWRKLIAEQSARQSRWTTEGGIGANSSYSGVDPEAYSPSRYATDEHWRIMIERRLEQHARELKSLSISPTADRQTEHMDENKELELQVDVSDDQLCEFITTQVYEHLDIAFTTTEYEQVRSNAKKRENLINSFRDRFGIRVAKTQFGRIIASPHKKIAALEMASFLNDAISSATEPSNAEAFFTEIGLIRGARKTPDVADPLYEIEADRITAGKRAVGLGIIAMIVGLYVSQKAMSKATELYWGLEYLVAKGASPVAAADNIRLFAYITKMVASALPGALGVYIFIRMAVLSKSFFFPSHLLRASDHEREALEGEQDDVSEALSGVASHAKRAGRLP